MAQWLRVCAPNAGGWVPSVFRKLDPTCRKSLHASTKLQPNKLKKENSLANAGDIKDTGFDPWVMKIPWRRSWQPTPVLLPENPTDRGAWPAIVHGVSKSWT